MVKIFQLFFYQPIFNALLWVYSISGQDLGIAIILLTVLIRVLLFPLGVRAIKSQKAISQLQPKLKELQEKYKDNKEEQAKAVIDLYKKEKINPFSGILTSLIQLPILIALYWVFMSFKGSDSASTLITLSDSQTAALYPFIHISSVNMVFLGVLNLTKPYLFLAIAAGVLQFWQIKMISPKNSGKNQKKSSDFAMNMQSQMQYFVPIFTIIILVKLSAAIAFYWIATTIFTICQQYFLFRKNKSVNA